MTTDASLPHARDTTTLAVRAGVERTGKPEPTAHEVQAYLDMHWRLEQYLDSAVDQWVKDNGVPHEGRRLRDVTTWTDRQWQDDLPNITVYYYATANDRYYGEESSFVIPIQDLLPEFGNALALMRALSS